MILANINCKVVLVSLYSSDAIGLRYVCSTLKKHGVDVHLIFFKEKYLEADSMSFPTEQEQRLLLDLIGQLRPDIIGISLRSSFVRIATIITERIRKEVGTPVIWGGTHPTVTPEESIQVADIICIGEGEQPMLELAQRLAEGEDFSDIPNLWVRRGNQVRRNSIGKLIQDLDNLPFPDYGNNGKYLIEENRVSAHDPALEAFNLDIMSSRGCPYHCSYCCNSVFKEITKGKGPPVRRRSVDNVIDEILLNKHKFRNLKRIDFIDEVFAWDKSWTSEFSRKYKEQVNLPFQCAQHPNMVDFDILSMLKEAGLERVEIGIQSGSERIRREVFLRPVSDATLIKAGQVISSLNIVPFYDLIVDNPFESEEDKQETLEFILKLPRPFHLRMFPLTYFPNTQLTKMALASRKISIEDVESMAERTHSKWFVTLDYPWSSEERFWISLYSLTSKNFIPKRLIWWLTRIRPLKSKPQLLSSFATLCNNIKLGTIALRWILDGKPIKAIVAHAPRRSSHWQI